MECLTLIKMLDHVPFPQESRNIAEMEAELVLESEFNTDFYEIINV